MKSLCNFAKTPTNCLNQTNWWPHFQNMCLTHTQRKVHLWLTSWLWCVSKYWEIPRQRSNCGWAGRAHTAAIQTTKCKEIFIWVIWTCKHAKLACITHIHTQPYAEPVCLAAAVDPSVSWTPSLRCTNVCMCVRVHLSRAAICGKILHTNTSYENEKAIYIHKWQTYFYPSLKLLCSSLQKKGTAVCVSVCSKRWDDVCHLLASLSAKLCSSAKFLFPERSLTQTAHAHVVSPTHMTCTHIPYWPTSFFARMKGALSICPYVCVFVCVFCWNR